MRKKAKIILKELSSDPKLWFFIPMSLYPNFVDLRYFKLKICLH